jgi:hypothetical protein
LIVAVLSRQHVPFVAVLLDEVPVYAGSVARNYWAFREIAPSSQYRVVDLALRHDEKLVWFVIGHIRNHIEQSILPLVALYMPETSSILALHVDPKWLILWTDCHEISHRMIAQGDGNLIIALAQFAGYCELCRPLRAMG